MYWLLSFLLKGSQSSITSSLGNLPNYTYHDCYNILYPLYRDKTDGIAMTVTPSYNVVNTSTTL